MSQDDKHSINVNLTSLLPEQLLKIQLELSGMEAQALLDTGSSTNFMRESLARSIGLLPDPSSRIRTKGIGSRSFRTEGEISAKFSFYNIDTKVVKFQVVKDDMISDEIILGWNFCKAYRVVIDSSNREIVVNHQDGSHTHIFLDAKSVKPTKILQENVKMYASTEANVCSDVLKVYVNFSYLLLLHSLPHCLSWWGRLWWWPLRVKPIQARPGFQKVQYQGWL